MRPCKIGFHLPPIFCGSQQCHCAQCRSPTNLNSILNNRPGELSQVIHSYFFKFNNHASHENTKMLMMMTYFTSSLCWCIFLPIDTFGTGLKENPFAKPPFIIAFLIINQKTFVEDSFVVFFPLRWMPSQTHRLSFLV